jgi:hypothetical protein
MTVNAMREAVISVYSGPAWRLKVQEMPDRQVIAIFRSMVDEGRLTKNGILAKRPHQPTFEVPKKKSEPQCIQLTIWDFYDKDGLKK